MIVLVAKYYVRSGQGDAVHRMLEQMAKLVASDEPACRFYNACRSTENEDMFLLYEQYVDEDALVAHRETPHFKSIIEAQVLPLLDKREREVYRLAVG